MYYYTIFLCFVTHSTTYSAFADQMHRNTRSHPCAVEDAPECKWAYLCGGFSQTLLSDPENMLNQLSSGCFHTRSPVAEISAQLNLLTVYRKNQDFPFFIHTPVYQRTHTRGLCKCSSEQSDLIGQEGLGESLTRHITCKDGKYTRALKDIVEEN